MYLSSGNNCLEENSSYLGNIKAGLPPSKKNSFVYFNESPLKIMINAFYFILKAVFVFKIFKFLSWLFWSCKRKRLDKKAWVNFKVYDLMGNKWLQYIYCPVSQEVKTITQWGLVNWQNTNWEISFFKNQAKNEAGKPPLAF